MCFNSVIGVIFEAWILDFLWNLELGAWNFLILLLGVFPFGIHFGLELAASDQFLQVTNDRSARHVELAREGRDVWTLPRSADLFANAVLAAQAVGRAAEKLQGINAPRAFKRFE